MKFLPPDAWTGTHLFGSFFLSRLLMQVIHEPGLAAGAALLLGVVWEIVVDEYRFNVFNPDPRGGDWGDIIADAVGCALSLWI